MEGPSLIGTLSSRDDEDRRALRQSGAGWYGLHQSLAALLDYRDRRAHPPELSSSTGQARHPTQALSWVWALRV